MYDYVLFDLDGTLTDPYIGITNSIIYSLQQMNIEAPDNSALIPFIGPPLHESYRTVYNLQDEDNATAIKHYRTYFSDKGMYENEVYAGIEIVLQALKAQGKQLFIATSKPTDFAIPILQHFKLDGYFNEIVGSNMDGTRTNKAEVIATVMNTHQLNPDKTVMIGDRMYDIHGAHQNNIDSIGVLYGYGSAEEIKAAKPTHTIATVDYLLDVLL
ncbi:HAD family hydrolase [Macrococcoides caseolyticum]|uniref:Phosphoglycolate phosphatase n=2 Tax=Macrococcoides caseolyticum TaxID=69966 RepID=A0ACC9MPV4_9STAP|nr:HAD family hydrolase [Macrococcus caseolyticus]ARQ05288.1 5'-nucleotidase [Macrococcus caseolyticus]PKD99079.1 phosphoglycolate phosphatase [Macrococcus caseolyticus]PKE05674.1 phosphoglycolate phosphatase [Macrococcus caseolyticus]PKE19395.1 phosphoglycolate phosphatase [Macrococcus caseolyticus]PKE21668.1 phosphoglycolate phosphatase [Macrococcus caseolyticus]